MKFKSGYNNPKICCENILICRAIMESRETTREEYNEMFNVLGLMYFRMKENGFNSMVLSYEYEKEEK